MHFYQVWIIFLAFNKGGSIWPPLVKSKKNDWNLVKRHVLAKIDYCCPLFMHLELNHYHFWPQKGPKNRCIFRRIEGSPFGFYEKKIVDVKFFGIYFWKIQKILRRQFFPHTIQRGDPSMPRFEPRRLQFFLSFFESKMVIIQLQMHK